MVTHRQAVQNCLRQMLSLHGASPQQNQVFENVLFPDPKNSEYEALTGAVIPITSGLRSNKKRPSGGLKLNPYDVKAWPGPFPQPQVSLSVSLSTRFPCLFFVCLLKGIH